MPSDIYPDSGSRLPPVKREDLDEQGKQQYGALVGRTGGRPLAGLRGPGGLNLYSPKAAQHLSGLSNYLRYEITFDVQLGPGQKPLLPPR